MNGELMNEVGEVLNVARDVVGASVILGMTALLAVLLLSAMIMVCMRCPNTNSGGLEVLPTWNR